MHIVVIAIWALLTLVISITQLPVRILETNIAWAEWLSSGSSIVAAAAALTAAILLHRTLSETQEATRLMQEQLKQNRAYVALESFSLAPLLHPQTAELTSYKVTASIRNSGASPAIEARYSYLTGVAKDGYQYGLKPPVLSSTRHTLGNNSTKILNFQIPLAVIKECMAGDRKLFGYVYIDYEYSDVHGRTYLYRATTLVDWPNGVLELSLIHI